MARIKDVSDGDHESWKVEIDRSIEYHVGITDIHENGASVEIRKSKSTGDVVHTLKIKGDRMYIKPNTADELFFLCKVRGLGRNRVAGEITARGGAASLSFTAASVSIGATS